MIDYEISLIKLINKEIVLRVLNYTNSYHNDFCFFIGTRVL